MIKQSEIKIISRQNGVPISTIERDYTQNWLLKYLPEMAFKGGTCLRKIYFKDYRFSDDLDFTLLEEISFTDLEEKISNAIQHAKTESNIEFMNEINSKKVTNGYSFDIFFRITRATGSAIKIKLDITKNKNEQIIDKLTQKVIKHPYSDKLNKKVLPYSLDEIFAEKTRSLFERTRPRDLYDVWYLNDILDLDKALFSKKCDFKKITPRKDKLQMRKKDFINSWENSLKHQLRKLPNAEKTFEDVINYLENWT